MWYLQKPTSLTVEEGRTLSNIVQDQGIILQVGTQQRSSPQFRYAAELVRNGRIGKLHTVKVGLPGDPPGPITNRSSSSCLKLDAGSVQHLKWNTQKCLYIQRRDTVVQVGFVKSNSEQE